MSIDISEQVAILDEELEWKFIRSSGPGGQNVNKVSSAVQLRFLLPRNTSISAPAKNRLRRMAGQRLVDLVRAALVEPKIRRKTRPTRASKERRIDSKKRRSSTKRDRGGRWD
jgi:ribosome-associated protein